MSRRKRLRQQAAQMRGRIDRGANRVRHRFDMLMHRVRTLARNPAALPIGFAGGFLSDRLHLESGVKRIYEFLALLGGPWMALEIASTLHRFDVESPPPLIQPAAAAQQRQREPEIG